MGYLNQRCREIMASGGKHVETPPYMLFGSQGYSSGKTGNSYFAPTYNPNTPRAREPMKEDFLKELMEYRPKRGRACIH